VPVLTIADLGVLRDVRVSRAARWRRDHADLFGCPAMNVIALEVELALAQAGFSHVRVKTVLSPAWTTDWMSEAGRTKLLAYGIAPPAKTSGRRALFGAETVACPRCGSQENGRNRRLRLDRLQGPAALRNLPRAVRCVQMSLTRPCHSGAGKRSPEPINTSAGERAPSIADDDARHSRVWVPGSRCARPGMTPGA
jgi:phenylacetate-CoA oxygenase PaaJ subunit